MSIVFKENVALSIDQIIEVYDSSGINRPTKDRARIQQMFEHSDLVISAWDGKRLVGIARSLTDFNYACYLSDLAVHKDYQHQGIGKTLISKTRQLIGPQSMLLLIAAPTAVNYYPKLQMEKVQNAFMYNRES
ncbi:MAG TPA: GNAT family N-acetyltransferase [Arachidicoccus sp.]|nr:GNAT family N-acetyltransferase [Arachidicoccus sp.]